MTEPDVGLTVANAQSRSIPEYLRVSSGKQENH